MVLGKISSHTLRTTYYTIISYIYTFEGGLHIVLKMYAIQSASVEERRRFQVAAAEQPTTQVKKSFIHL